MLFFVPNFALPKGKNNSLEGALLDIADTHIHTRTLFI